MAYPKLKLLVEKLHKNTLKNKVEWEATAKPDTYQAAFSNYTLQIFETKPKEKNSIGNYTIEIFDSDGDLMESIWDFDLDDPFSDHPEDQKYYHKMREIHETARRMALGTEQAVNTILEILDEDGDEIPF